MELPLAVVKGLNDKLYEKRKTAALEIEKIIRDHINESDKIASIISVLTADFVYGSHTTNYSRTGGLIALAAVAVALGTEKIGPYLNDLISPIINSFTDTDAKTRYYACESLFNVSKVARYDIVKYFDEIFDSLCKSFADPDISVKNAAELLDRLIKEIIIEYGNEDHSQDTENTTADKIPKVPGTTLRFNQSFDLVRFVPLVQERLKTLNPFSRMFIVGWISVLLNIPDFELVSVVPSMLSGLFEYVGDDNNDVSRAALKCLEEFLAQLMRVVQVQVEKNYLHILVTDLPLLEPTRSNWDLYSQFEGAVIDLEKIIDIVCHFVHSNNSITKLTAIKWIDSILQSFNELMLVYSPLLLPAILPALSLQLPNSDSKSSMVSLQIRTLAKETNQRLYQLIYNVPSDLIMGDPVSEQMALKIPKSVHQNVKFELKPVLDSLTLHFRNENEETRIASMEWFLMLHEKAPRMVFKHTDEKIFSVLFKTLSDSSDEVVKRDLSLLVQIAHHSDDSYFTKFILKLTSLFAVDRNLLETRGVFIFRQLCTTLAPERIYKTFSEILMVEQNTEFASFLVQNLNLILLSTNELHPLRLKLMSWETDPEAAHLFTVIYKSWSTNPVSTLALCLLARAYEHASLLIYTISECPITVSLLVQLDKLVQLLESPVFTSLRMHLLEPDKYPHLYKCMYGLLMILPQSSAFATLRNRLGCVNSMVMMYTTGMPFERGAAEKKNTKKSLVNWKDLLDFFKGYTKPRVSL